MSSSQFVTVGFVQKRVRGSRRGYSKSVHKVLKIKKWRGRGETRSGCHGSRSEVGGSPTPPIPSSKSDPTDWSPTVTGAKYFFGSYQPGPTM